MLLQGQTKSNEGFLGPMEKGLGFPLVSEGDGAVVRALRTEHCFVTCDAVLMFFAVPKTTVNYFLRSWNTKLARFFTSSVCLVQERPVQGLPFVVFSVANCITLRTGCFISRSCPAWSEKNRQCFAGVNDTSVVTHKQTFNRQACAIKKEASLLLFERAFRSALAR